MKILNIEEVHYKKVQFELSCGASLWISLDIDFEPYDEWLERYLCLKIKQISYYPEGGEIDVYQSDGDNGMMWSNLFHVKETPKLLEIIQSYNEGGHGACHTIGTSDKDAIRLFVKEII